MHWNAKLGKNKRPYIVCEGCGHWVWEDRKVARCFQCGGFFPGFRTPDSGGGAAGVSKEPGGDTPDLQTFLPLLEAMGSLPVLQPFVDLLKKMVPEVQPDIKKSGWQESKQRAEKANKEVQKFEGNQKRLEENIKQWEQKLEAAHIELKGTKDGLVLAYVEQTEAQADKRQLL